MWSIALRLALASLAVTGGGCRLIVELVETNPQHDPSPDAMSLTDPRCTTWSHTSETFEPCELPTPTASLELGDGIWTLDTNSGSLTDPNDDASFPASALITAQGIEARVVSIERFSLASGATLNVRGKRPLIIATWSDADIAGLIDLTSRSRAPAAGANPDACGSSGNGADNTEGAGGGGGGGFATNGAPGGSGADGLGAAGGAGAAAPAITLRGGCAGGVGGNALHGIAGDGGGAIEIAAREQIVLDGAITAGGAGGGAAQGGRGGGGGGGSGGYVGLSAMTIILGPSAIIAANGGGGGGGSDGSPASGGQDGQPSTTAATGGPGQGMGSGGGAGGARGSVPKPGIASHRGGGGGGGSVGVVKLDASVATLPATAVISPPSQ